jgi:hypothetical protein
MKLAGCANRQVAPGRRREVTRRAIVGTILGLLAAGDAQGQDLQLWSNLTLKRIRSHRLSYQVEVEPKVLVAADGDQPGWWTLDVIPNAEYVLKPWLDLVGEVQTGYTAQTDDLNSFELSPRGGVRLHLLSRDVRRVVDPRELPPKRRFVITDLARVEFRNLFYNQDLSTDSSVRFRNRLEFLVSLNKDRLTEDGARYLRADWEWFIPVDDVTERFANKQRVRMGIGYRRSFRWRGEVLYIWNRSRNSADDGFTTSDHIIDLRFTRVF